MAGKGRLKKGDISLREMLELSAFVYEGEVDNKKKRAKMDIVRATTIHKNNISYDRSKKEWVQTGRNAKIVILVRSDPVSYKKTDNIKLHTYPVTFLIEDIDKGIDSPFRWRTGSFKKPQSISKKISDCKTKQEKNRQRKENRRVSESNIRNGIQMAFIFENMQVLDMFELLYGPNTTNRKIPKIKNPELIPYFDKTSYFVVTKIIIPLLTTHRHLLGKKFTVTND